MNKTQVHVTTSSKAPPVWSELQQLWEYRELLHTMVVRELKIRYKNSFFGFVWSLINPLLTVFTMWFIFHGKTSNYSAYVMAAYLPYMFFSMSIMDATSSILSSLSMIRKIYFPREIMPLATLISNFIHFLLALCVLFLYLFGIYAKSLLMHEQASFPIQPTTIYLPLLLVISFLMASGVGLLLSALNAFFEDVKYIVQFLLSMLLFLSPIMYMLETKHEEYSVWGYRMFCYLNPVGIMCNAYRKILIAPQKVPVDGKGLVEPLGIEWNHIAYAGIFSVVVFLYGYRVFNIYKWRFVERP